MEDNNSIVGKWENDIISTEFFEDGTYFFTGPYTERGTWVVIENRNITMTSRERSVSGSYRIVNNVLTISLENRGDTILTRVENLRIDDNVDENDEILRQLRLELIEALQNDPHDVAARNLLDLVNLLLWGR
jgi:hypothetical protein